MKNTEKEPIFSTRTLAKVSYCGRPNCMQGVIRDISPEGRYIDKPCPECAKIRKNLINGNVPEKERTIQLDENISIQGNITSILRQLNIDTSFEGIYKFNPANVIPKQYKKYVPEYVQEEFLTALSNILTDLEQSIVPLKSHLFIFDLFDPLDFMFTCISKAYEKGLFVAPFMTEYELNRIISNDATESSSDEPINKDYVATYEDIVRADFCMLEITSGCTKRDMYRIKSLMENRMAAGKTTILCARYVGSNLQILKDIYSMDEVSTSSRHCEIHYLRYVVSETDKRKLQDFPVKKGEMSPLEMHKIIFHNKDMQ